MKQLLVVGLLMASPFVAAESIDYKMDCPKGGSRAVTGDYIPLTGVFSTETTVSKCINKAGAISNGTVTANGVFKIKSDGTASLDAQINRNMVRETTNRSVSQQCDRALSGTYDAKTSYFKGKSTSTCEKTGAIYAPVLELVAGLNEQESLESQSKTSGSESEQQAEALMVGTWTGCSYLNTATLQIDANGKAILINDDTGPIFKGDYSDAIYCDGVVANRRYIGTCEGRATVDSGIEHSIIDVALDDKDDENVGVSISGSNTLTGGNSGSYSISCPIKHPSKEPVPDSPFSTAVQSTP